MPRIGLNLDPTLVGNQDELVGVGVRAAQLGFDQLWVAARSRSPFRVISELDEALRAIGVPNASLGIPVIPISSWHSPGDLARTVLDLRSSADGRFTFGIGVGHPSAETEGKPLDRKPVAHLREYLTLLRADFESTSEEGRVDGSQDIYLGALGPVMLRLAGELGDGVVLNWATPAHIEWSRDRIAEGARKATSDHTVSVVTQLRVCIDDDAVAARRVLAHQMIAMTLRDPIERPDRGYRAHMGRLGHEQLFTDLARQLEDGVDRRKLASQIPDHVVDSLGYAGPAAGAREGIGRLSQGADAVIVRIVPLDGDPGSVSTALEACAP